MIFREFTILKKFFQCIDSEISLTHCIEMSAVYQNMLNSLQTDGQTTDAARLHKLMEWAKNYISCALC